MKKVCSVLLALLLTAGLSLSLFGMSVHAEDENGYAEFVYDYADLLSYDEYSKLETKAEKIWEDTGCGVYIVIVEDYTDYVGGSIEDFAEYAFDEIALGNDAVILAISLEERDYDIDAHGSLGNMAFTDYGKEQIAGDMVPYLREDDWCGGFKTFVSDCGEYLELALDGNPVDVPPRQHTNLLVCILIGLIPGALVSFLILSAMKSSMKTARIAKAADQYAVSEKVALSRQTDQYTHSTTTVVHIERSNSGGGSGGTTVNSGGHSHHSGKF